MSDPRSDKRPREQSAQRAQRPDSTPGSSSERLTARRAVLATGALAGASLLLPAPMAFASASSAPSASGKRMLTIPEGNRVFGVNRASFDKYGYSPAVWSKGLLFVAGQVGIRPDGTVPDSPAEQAEWALRRMMEILRLAKLSSRNLVDVVSYHVDLSRNIDAFLQAKSSHLARPSPAWSIIGVKALARPQLKIEIQATAAV